MWLNVFLLVFLAIGRREEAWVLQHRTHYRLVTILDKDLDKKNKKSALEHKMAKLLAQAQPFLKQTKSLLDALLLSEHHIIFLPGGKTSEHVSITDDPLAALAAAAGP